MVCRIRGAPSKTQHAMPHAHVSSGPSLFEALDLQLLKEMECLSPFSPSLLAVGLVRLERYSNICPDVKDNVHRIVQRSLSLSWKLIAEKGSPVPCQKVACVLVCLGVCVRA